MPRTVPRQSRLFVRYLATWEPLLGYRAAAARWRRDWLLVLAPWAGFCGVAVFRAGLALHGSALGWAVSVLGLAVAVIGPVAMVLRGLRFQRQYRRRLARHYSMSKPPRELPPRAAAAFGEWHAKWVGGPSQLPVDPPSGAVEAASDPGFSVRPVTRGRRLRGAATRSSSGV